MDMCSSIVARLSFSSGNSALKSDERSQYLFHHLRFAYTYIADFRCEANWVWFSSASSIDVKPVVFVTAFASFWYFCHSWVTTTEVGIHGQLLFLGGLHMNY